MMHHARHPGDRIFRRYANPEQEVISRLTNWQRKRWDKAGRPRDLAEMERFARLQRDGTELYTGEILAPEQPARAAGRWP